MKYITEDILNCCLKELGIPVTYLPLIKGKNRASELVQMRKGVARLLFGNGLSYAQIGRLLKKDGTTIGHYLRSWK